MCQIDRYYGTFWYLRHLGPLGLLENVTDIIWDFRKLKEIDGKRLQDIPFSLPYTLQHPQNTSGHSKTHSGTPNTSLCPPGTALTSTKRSLDSLTQTERHLSCQGMPGGTLWEMRVSEDVCWVSGMFVSVYVCLWQYQGYVRGVMGVSGDIWGCLGGV